MGTYLRITLHGIEDARAESLAETAFDRIRKVNDLMSIYRSDSEFSVLNSAAGAESVSISTETMYLLSESKRYHKITAGTFDPSIGPLMELWHLREKGNVPTEQEIDSTLALIGLDGLYIDETQNRAFIAEGMELDSGGIAKGYAVDLAIASLRHSGVSGAMVDLGGNIGLLGSGPSENGYWRIGIRNPLVREDMIAVLQLKDVTTATSGQYEQYFIHEGKRYGHLLDPRTGRPADALLSTTIISPEGIAADALSTGVFILGPEEGMALVERLPAVEAVIILDPGPGNPLTQEHVLISSGLTGRIQWNIPP
jgi:thiamine biosynthesis lipoprotein